MLYRIYGNAGKGWELITVLYKEELVENFLELETCNNYNRVIVIQHDIMLNMDSVYTIKQMVEERSRTR